MPTLPYDGIYHAFESSFPDGADPTKLQPSHQNAKHLGNGLRIVNVADYGAIAGVSAAVCTAAVQAAAIDAIAAPGSILLFPSIAPYAYEIDESIILEPEGLISSFAQVSMIGGGDMPGIQWVGANNQAVFYGKGWKYSTIQNLNIQVPSQSGVVGWECSDEPPNGSTGHLTFINCHVTFYGAGTAGIGWRGGLNGGTDASCFTFIDCTVGSDDETKGRIGWSMLHANVLNWCWHNGGATFLDTAISTEPLGGSVFTYGFCTSHNLNEYIFAGGLTAGIHGGRYEVGQRFGFYRGDTGSGSYPSTITLEGVEISGYAPADDILFQLTPAAELVLINPMINNGGGIAGPYTEDMIHLGGGGTARGSLRVSNGVIQGAADPFYKLIGSANWKVAIEDVGKQDSPAGSMVDHYLNRQGIGGRVNDRRSSVPTTGAHKVGDTYWHTAPAAAGFMGWVCTTDGTPGTFKTFGAITA